MISRAGDDRKVGPAPVRGHRSVRGQDPFGGWQPMPPGRVEGPDPRSAPRPASAVRNRTPVGFLPVRTRSEAKDPDSGLRAIFDRLAAAYGPQGWWPARGPFEMMAGALLTQRTAWRNAELAIASLRRAGALSPEVLAVLPTPALEALVRPAGTFRAKAVRLRALARWYVEAGGREPLMQRPTPELRSELLGLPGIGPETADDILVYVFARPVFVVDTYARRIFSRYGWARGDEPYDRLSATVAGALHRDATALGELHALLVEHGKRHCRATPRCPGCPLAAQCEAAPHRAKLGPGS